MRLPDYSMDNETKAFGVLLRALFSFYTADCLIHVAGILHICSLMIAFSAADWVSED